MNDLQIAAHGAGCRQRGSHATKIQILPAMLDEQRVEVSKPPFGALCRIRGDRLVETEDPIGHRENQLYEAADGHPARKLAAGVAAHAIGDDHGVAGLLRPLGYLPGWQRREHGLQVNAQCGSR